MVLPEIMCCRLLLPHSSPPPPGPAPESTDLAKPSTQHSEQSDHPFLILAYGKKRLKYVFSLPQNRYCIYEVLMTRRCQMETGCRASRIFTQIFQRMMVRHKSSPHQKQKQWNSNLPEHHNYLESLLQYSF